MKLTTPVRIGIIVAILGCIGFPSSASSRPWKPTPSQIAADYASINHNRGNGDVVTIGWWSSPTATPGSRLASVFERYVLISITHSHLNLKEPATGLRFDDVDKLEVRDESGNQLAPFDPDVLPPANIGNLAAFEAGYRQGLGPRGKGTKFFLFEAGGVHACEKGGISVPYDGETYTWETPFPGCSTSALKQEPRAVSLPEPWNIAPTITVVSAAGDPRLPLVRDAIAFWNDTFAELGTPFRLGALRQVVDAIPVEDLTMLNANYAGLPDSLNRIEGNIVVALSEGEFISFMARRPALNKAVVAIKDYRSPPLTLPNVTQNVIAHLLGLTLGLSHNADRTTLMCGRPAPCRPGRYASDLATYFPLTKADKAALREMYPSSWRASPL
jgi:hypothetical protein